jgi:hypothetical protein
MAIVPSTTRFIGISPSVNLTERKSNITNAETQPYTMQDIIDTAATAQATNAAAEFIWSAGFSNLINGFDNRIPFNFNSISNANFSLIDAGTVNASIRVNTSGLYLINTKMNFFDIGDGIRFETKIFKGVAEPLSFLQVFQSSIYDNGNTNQIIDGTTMIQLNANDLIGIVVTPSANTPYPCDLGGLTPQVEIIKIA